MQVCKIMVLIKIICMLQLILGIYGSTHWVVTENGLIQPQLDSPFNMARPYDLLAFLDQDIRRNKVIEVYEELTKKKDSVNKHWEEIVTKSETDATSDIYDNCIKGGPINLVDWYMGVMDDGTKRDGIFKNEFKIESTVQINTLEAMQEPNCKQWIPMPFSMFAFEHLEAMKNRNKLSISPEFLFANPVIDAFGVDVEVFGHQVARNLEHNQTSWLHYNLASLYWRIKGDAPHAIECSRRAVLFAPRRFRDIALLNLGYIFHMAHHSMEAVNILHAAVDHSPTQHEPYFALGNAYAVVSGFNKSLLCYDHFLKFDTDPVLQNVVINNKNSVVCHKVLLERMVALQESINNIRRDLLEYQARQDQWLGLQEKILKGTTLFPVKDLPFKVEQLPITDSCAQRSQEDPNSPPQLDCFLKSLPGQEIYHNKNMYSIDNSVVLHKMLKDVTAQVKHLSSQMSMSEGGTKSVISQLLARPTLDFSDEELMTDGIMSEGNTKVEPDSNNDSSEAVSDEEINDDDDRMEIEESKVKYSPTMSVSRIREEFDKSSDWPTEESCEKWLPTFIPDDQLIYPVYLPLENKGLNIKSLLSDKIGLMWHREHPLPWRPPLCPASLHNKAVSQYIPKKLLTKFRPQAPIPAMENSDRLLRVLAEYVSDENIGFDKDFNIAEIGQRILSAIKKKVAPKWILFTLSSLYWRARDNPRNALECLCAALGITPAAGRDVVLVSLGAVLLQLGYVDEATLATSEALAFNKNEPATNFLVSLIHMKKGNSMGQLFHLRRVLRVEPGFMHGLALSLLRTWACRARMAPLQSVTKGLSESEMCVVSKMGDSVSGHGVLCKAGQACQPANIHCYKADDIADSLDVDEGSLETLLIAPTMEADGRQAYRIHILLSDKNSDQHTNTLVSLMPDLDEEREVSTSGSPAYSTSARSCGTAKVVDWMKVVDLTTIIKERNIDLAEELKSVKFYVGGKKPVCECPPSSAYKMENLEDLKLRPLAPEPALAPLLAQLLQPHDTQHAGAVLAELLEEGPQSWRVTLLSALWGRVWGDTGVLVDCLQASLHLAPRAQKDLSLLAMAAVAQEQNLLEIARDLAEYAYKVQPTAFNTYVVGYFNALMGDHEEAVHMFRVALTIAPTFEAAKESLQATLCALLFHEDGTVKRNTNIDF